MGSLIQIAANHARLKLHGPLQNGNKVIDGAAVSWQRRCSGEQLQQLECTSKDHKAGQKRHLGCQAGNYAVDVGAPKDLEV